MVLGRDPGTESCAAHRDMESSVQNSGRQAMLEACVKGYTPVQTSCWASVKDPSKEETCLHRVRASHPPQEHQGSWCRRIFLTSPTSCPCTRSLRKESMTNHPHRHHRRWTGGGPRWTEGMLFRSSYKGAASPGLTPSIFPVLGHAPDTLRET